MGWWTDIAEKRAGTPNHGGPMVEQRGLVVHIAEGTYDGTIAWQQNPAAQVSSHFVVAKDGRIAQCVDTDVTAWTQQLGNGHWLSVENAGFTPGALTPAQIEANAQILARGHLVYGYPLQIATAPSGRGLGHHSMGAENHVQWGHADCPGPAIIAQKPIILARALQIAAGGDDMTPQQASELADCLTILTGMANGVDSVPVHDKDGVLSLVPLYRRIAQEVAKLPAASGAVPDHEHTQPATTGPVQRSASEG